MCDFRVGLTLLEAKVALVLDEGLPTSLLPTFQRERFSMEQVSRRASPPPGRSVGFRSDEICRAKKARCARRWERRGSA